MSLDSALTSAQHLALKVVIYAQRPVQTPGRFAFPLRGGDVADPLFTYAELTRLFPAREGTLRAWASEDKITPARTAGRRKLFRHRDFQRHTLPGSDHLLRSPQQREEAIGRLVEWALSSAHLDQAQGARGAPARGRSGTQAEDRRA